LILYLKGIFAYLGQLADLVLSIGMSSAGFVIAFLGSWMFVRFCIDSMSHSSRLSLMIMSVMILLAVTFGILAVIKMRSEGAETSVGHLID
jgi:hypothetical protein